MREQIIDVGDNFKFTKIIEVEHEWGTEKKLILDNGQCILELSTYGVWELFDKAYYTKTREKKKVDKGEY